jgi:hypothetical protein
MIPKLERFPRSQKFILADRIETLMLDILDLLIEAAYTRNKRSLLLSANLKLEKLRYLVRISKYNKAFKAGSATYVMRIRIICEADCLAAWPFKGVKPEVLRGGSMNNNRDNARCANRNRNHPNKRNNNIGFRCASTFMFL